jgi:nucleoid-associated protein YgaU
MGLFDFAKSAGRKVGLFGGREAAEAEVAAAAAVVAVEAAKTATDDAERIALSNQAVAADITAAILSYVDIQELVVQFDGNTAIMTGTATAQADQEKALLVAGNTEGVAAVDDQLVVEIPEPPAVYHQVVAGDTLSDIAMQYYGLMRMYDVVFEANKPMLDHPDKIYVGQTLRIPPSAEPTHEVKQGETLFSISKHWYGDGMKYTAVYEANTSVLSSPDVVERGQRLRIPFIEPKVAPLRAV